MHATKPEDRTRIRHSVADVRRYLAEIEDTDDAEAAEEAAGAVLDVILSRDLRRRSARRSA